jgi:hypothetical protein
MRRFALAFALPLLLVALPGCRKDQRATAPDNLHVPGTPHTDEVLAAFRKAGLLPDGFVASKPVPEAAAYCEHGKVGGVDTTICEYRDDQALDRGVQAVRAEWARVDAHTGVVVRAKRTLLAVVDRERREPSGKTINQMINVFSAL